MSEKRKGPHPPTPSPKMGEGESRSDGGEGFKPTDLGDLPAEWDVVRLSEAVNFSRKPRGLNLAEYDAIPFIPMELIPDNGTTIKKYETREKISSGTYCERGDILLAKITPSFENGKQGIVSDIPLDFAYATTEAYPLKAKPDKLDQMFLFHLLKLPSLRVDIAGKMEGTTGRQRIPKLVVENHPIPLPPLDEQRRIAHVLNTVQQAIAAQDDLIAAAQEVKRSLMRRLFTYGPGSEPAPTKETDIGEVPAHWEVVRLREVVEVKGGKRLPKGEPFAENPSTHPYIRVVDFQNNSVNRSDLKFITDEIYEKIRRYVIRSKDVYISIAGTIGLVGTVPKELDGANLTENAAKLVIKDEHNLLNHFLVYYLSSNNGQKQIQIRAAKTSQPKLALTRIKQIPVPIISLDEQHQIAHILQTADAKIAAEQDRRAALAALFNSLLQELMTGRLRVNEIEIGNE